MGQHYLVKLCVVPWGLVEECEMYFRTLEEASKQTLIQDYLVKLLFPKVKTQTSLVLVDVSFCEVLLEDVALQKYSLLWFWVRTLLTQPCQREQLIHIKRRHFTEEIFMIFLLEEFRFKCCNFSPSATTAGGWFTLNIEEFFMRYLGIDPDHDAVPSEWDLSSKLSVYQSERMENPRGFSDDHGNWELYFSTLTERWKPKQSLNITLLPW